MKCPDCNREMIPANGADHSDEDMACVYCNQIWSPVKDTRDHSCDVLEEKE